MDTPLFESFDDEPARPAAWRRGLVRLHPGRLLHTLKARLAAVAVLGLLATLAITGWRVGVTADSALLTHAQASEQLDAEHRAAMIGRQVASMQRALRLVAREIDPRTLRSPEQLGQLLTQRPLMRTLFSNVTVVDPDGRVLVVVDGDGARLSSANVRDRDYFRRTVDEHRPLISRPVDGRVSNEPVVLFTQPIDGPDGVDGVVVAALGLTGRDFFADAAPAAERQGLESMLVVTDDQGHILAHPQRARLLGSLDAEPRLQAAYAQWVAAGRPALPGPAAWRQPREVVGMATDPVSGWHVWHVTSEEALLAPLRPARQRALLEAGAAVAALALLLALVVAAQLRPLVLLERRAAQLLAGDAASRNAAWPEAEGEIGQLSRTLRHVWAERLQMENFNAEVLQKLSSVMAAAPVGLAFTRNQHFELVSEELWRLLGRSEQELLGQHMQGIFASNADYQALGPLVDDAFAAQQPYVGEWQLLRADGALFWARLRARPVQPGEAAAGIIWTLYDISDQVTSRRLLEHAALHDALTGLLNRKGFERATAGALRGADSGPAAIVMIDLDRFKPINDTRGHAAGDAMLKAVAGAIASHVRASDAVARTGGDEFVIYLPHCDQARAAAVAEKVRHAVASLEVPWEGSTLTVGASLGVAERSDDFVSVDEWIAAADAACYEAKRAGRDTVRMAANGGLRLVGDR